MNIQDYQRQQREKIAKSFIGDPFGIEKADKLRGGLADKKKPKDYDPKELDMGVKVEMEHTDDPTIAREIALDHLKEDKKYYSKLKTIEKAEEIDEIEKGKKMPIGTVSGKYKKVAEGKWVEVKQQPKQKQLKLDQSKLANSQKDRRDYDMHVEYVGDRDGEGEFTIGGRVYQYVTGKYSTGNTDIAVYDKSTDTTLGYEWFRTHVLKDPAGQHKDPKYPDSFKTHEVIDEAFKVGGVFSGKDTLDIYKTGGYYESGGWTPERAKLHDNVVKEYLKKGKKPEGKPVSIMMGGAPASGKSSVIKAGLLDVPDGLVNIDADEMKAQLPEYQQMSKNKDHRGAAFAHEESSYLSKRVLKESTGEGFGVLMDGTGNTSAESVKKKVAMIKAAGHRVVANYVTLDLDLSLKNNEERFKKTGRKVPESYVKKVNKNIPNIVEQALKGDLGFDELHLYDTNINGKPRKILDYIDGKLTMHDKKLYDNFMKKKDIEL